MTISREPMGHAGARGTRSDDAHPAMHHVRTVCRACDEARLTRFLSLGMQPLANANLRSMDAVDDERRFPLDLCLCESCGLVQLIDVIDPRVLFENYPYLTGTSETIRQHYVEYSRTVVDLLALAPHDLVVEVASNDGSLLDRFVAAGVRTLGVEPASNLAELARARGIETVEAFFGGAVGEHLRGAHGAARVVIGNNVLAHVDDTRDFLRGAQALLAPDGLVVMEVPYVRRMLERLEYDTVYHEHLCYFSVTALRRMFEAVGLTLIRVDEVTVHGGSLRLYAGHAARHPSPGDAVLQMIDEEASCGLAGLPRWQQFARDVEAQRLALRALLERLRDEGKTVAGYGAPAKGNTLLNYCDIGTDLVQYTVDRNPLKRGAFTPGMHLPILPPETLVERQPDFVLLLAWNLADEIMQQQQVYRNAGGRFIVPVPFPRIL